MVGGSGISQSCGIHVLGISKRDQGENRGIKRIRVSFGVKVGSMRALKIDRVQVLVRQDNE